MTRPDDLARELQAASIVINAGPPGVQLLPASVWQKQPGLKVLIDLNAVPPLGIEGVEATDKGKERCRRQGLGCPGRRWNQDEDPQEGHQAALHRQRPCPRRRGSPGAGPFAGLIDGRRLLSRRGHAVVRVVGTDPGTLSLDLLLLEDGRVVDQRRFTPEELEQRAPGAGRGPFDAGLLSTSSPAPPVTGCLWCEASR